MRYVSDGLCSKVWTTLGVVPDDGSLHRPHELDRYFPVFMPDGSTRAISS